MIIPVDKIPTDPMENFPNLRQQELIQDIEDIVKNRYPVCEIISLVPTTQIPRGASLRGDLKFAIDAVVKQIQEINHLNPFDGASAFDLKAINPKTGEPVKLYITFDIEKWDQMIKEATVA